MEDQGWNSSYVLLLKNYKSDNWANSKTFNLTSWNWKLSNHRSILDIKQNYYTNGEILLKRNVLQTKSQSRQQMLLKFTYWFLHICVMKTFNLVWLLTFWRYHFFGNSLFFLICVSLCCHQYFIFNEVGFFKPCYIFSDAILHILYFVLKRYWKKFFVNVIISVISQSLHLCMQNMYAYSPVITWQITWKLFQTIWEKQKKKDLYIKAFFLQILKSTYLLSGNLLLLIFFSSASSKSYFWKRDGALGCEERYLHKILTFC